MEPPRREETRQSPPPPATPAPPLHQMVADEDDDMVKYLGECSRPYLSLQDCLVESNRNWKKCQTEVQALKACQLRKMRQQ